MQNALFVVIVQSHTGMFVRVLNENEENVE